jgi:hypothetical protein
MFCSQCGASNEANSKFCSSCGRQMTIAEQFNAPASESNSSAVSGKNSKAKVWIWVGLGLFALSLLTGQSLLGFLTGEVTLDATKVEQSIKAEIKKQMFIDVTVNCPHPMAAKVGETRQCWYKNSLIGTRFIDVTVQSTTGDITWKTQ